MPATRKLITISLPPPLLKRAEQVAEEENRSKSELFREALRFYVETRNVRKGEMSERLSKLLGKAQRRSAAEPPRQIRKVIRETIGAVRAGKPPHR